MTKRVAGQSYEDLPQAVYGPLKSVNTPPRLEAHLTLVHDVATQLVRRIRGEYPDLPFGAAEVLFGAATHDIGKASYPAELLGPGSAHEQAGTELLANLGIPDSLARFARTHASWKSCEVTLEDLLVSLADKIWKGTRQEDLEQMLVSRISLALCRPE